jgi:hypothetical protein
VSPSRRRLGRIAREDQIDRKALARAVREARARYRLAIWWEKYHPPEDAPDTLLKLAAVLGEAERLLAEPINAKRLVMVRGWGAATPVMPEVYDFSYALLAYRRLARMAHRGRGRPSQKGDLRAAYDTLVALWKEHPRQFTNEWQPTTDGLAPTSLAACFLYDVLRWIDPNRDRLAKELRALMAKTVKNLPGPRRGRRNLS